MHSTNMMYDIHCAPHLEVSSVEGAVDIVILPVEHHLSVRHTDGPEEGPGELGGGGAIG